MNHDVKLIFEDYAWEVFTDLRHLSKNVKNDVCFDISRKRLSVQHFPPEYSTWNRSPAKPYTLFKTEFTNTTDREQVYSFKTERSTESICSVTREQGFNIGEEAELTLKTPCEILEFKAGFKHEIQVLKAEETATCEMLAWGVDSSVAVPAHYRTTAELVVEELSYHGSFKVVSQLAGRVIISIRRRRDGELIMAITANVVEIFHNMTRPGKSLQKESRDMIMMESNCVKLVSQGKCDFQFAIKQEVTLSEEKLSCIIA
ncbi:unnamed protein product, partial [Soboliphyme baturini]|uniref:VWFD domain-containing protein n=1 Tax=Soboliphyme baturini TaxID=241478 RepID=A0A183IPW9_9BILA